MTHKPPAAVPVAAAPGAEPLTDQETGHAGPQWYSQLPREHRPAFWASSVGWALDAFDFNTLPLALTAIGAQFALSPSKSGLIMTVTLVASAVGGSLAGLLADRIGRTRVLMITIGTFAVFTALSGLSQNYTEILLFKGIQGLGFGGEWSVGAVLIAEVAPARFRGRLLGYVSTSWALGWALAIVAYTLIFSYAGHDAWRYLFFVGILPAVALLFMRRNVKDSQASEKSREEAAVQKSVGSGFSALFRRDLRRTTLLTLLIGIGTQGGYYAVFTWLPSYLHTTRGLTVVGTSGYLAVVIAGSFLGYAFAGHLHDRIGRRPTFIIFAVTGVVCVLAYTQIPAQANVLLLVLGIPLGMAAAGSLAGNGVFFSELFPSRVRGAGVGLAHNFGRGVAAFFPFIVGALSTVLGLRAAIGVGAIGYLLVVIGALALPETRGREIA
jgi:MFS family permease